MNALESAGQTQPRSIQANSAGALVPPPFNQVLRGPAVLALRRQLPRPTRRQQHPHHLRAAAVLRGQVHRQPAVLVLRRRAAPTRPPPAAPAPPPRCCSDSAATYIPNSGPHMRILMPPTIRTPKTASQVMASPFTSLANHFMQSPRKQLESGHLRHTTSTSLRLKWLNASYTSKTYSSKGDSLKYATSPPLQLETTALLPPNWPKDV